MKVCTNCKQEKPIKDFYTRTDTGKKKSQCKQCESTKTRRRRYDISEDEFDKLMLTTNCDCCGKELPTKYSKYIDHCYKTNKIRGILCNSCNAGIGKLGDNTEGVLRALEYLNKAKNRILI